MIVPIVENIDKVLGPTFNLVKERVTMLVNTFTNEEKTIIEKYLRDVINVMEEVTHNLLALK